MKKNKNQSPEYPKIIETFDPPGSYDLRSQSEPSAFNGIVRVERFRITIEKIEEPIEVIGERLEKLWTNSNNHHHYYPIENKAASLGYELKGKFGENVKNKLR